MSLPIRNAGLVEAELRKGFSPDRRNTGTLTGLANVYRYTELTNIAASGTVVFGIETGAGVVTLRSLELTRGAINGHVKIDEVTSFTSPTVRGAVRSVDLGHGVAAAVRVVSYTGVTGTPTQVTNTEYFFDNTNVTSTIYSQGDIDCVRLNANKRYVVTITNTTATASTLAIGLTMLEER